MTGKYVIVFKHYNFYRFSLAFNLATFDERKLSALGHLNSAVV